MNALVAIAAAPIAFLVIAGLLRWPRALAAFGADPRPDRWHSSPTPAFGGIGIFAGFAVAVLVAIAIGPVGIPSEMLGVVIAGLIVFTFGLLDDTSSSIRPQSSPPSSSLRSWSSTARSRSSSSSNQKLG